MSRRNWIKRNVSSAANRSHPLAVGRLVDLAIPAGSTRLMDMSGYGRHPTNSGGVSALNAYGPAWRSDTAGNGDYLEISADESWIPTTETTIVFGWRKTDSSNRNSTAFGVGAGSGGTNVARCGVHLPYGDGRVYWDFANFSSGRLSVGGLTFGNDLWVFSVGPRGMEIWQNGYLRASKTTSATRTVDGALPFSLGRGNGQGDASDLAECWMFRMYNRQLSRSLIAETFRDPWGLYRHQHDEAIGEVAAPSGGGFIDRHFPRGVLRGITRGIA